MMDFFAPDWTERSRSLMIVKTPVREPKGTDPILDFLRGGFLEGMDHETQISFFGEGLRERLYLRQDRTTAPVFFPQQVGPLLL